MRKEIVKVGIEFICLIGLFFFLNNNEVIAKNSGIGIDEKFQDSNRRNVSNNYTQNYQYQYRNKKAIEKARQDSIRRADSIVVAQKRQEFMEDSIATKESYDKIISNADEFFNEEEWEEAIKTYTEALDMFPGEQYPKNRIDSAQKLMNTGGNSNLLLWIAIGISSLAFILALFILIFKTRSNISIINDEISRLKNIYLPDNYKKIEKIKVRKTISKESLIENDIKELKIRLKQLEGKMED